MKTIRLIAPSGIFAITAFRQTAQLTGTANDKSDSSAPGPKIVATNVATGVARATVANESGNYLITALLPGGYRVSGEAPGFKQVDPEPIALDVDQVARLHARGRRAARQTHCLRPQLGRMKFRSTEALDGSQRSRRRGPVS